MNILVLLLQRRSKSTPQMQRWTLGILGTWRREQVVSRICNQLRWQMGFRASQMVEDVENSRHPVFKGMSTSNGECCNIDLLYRTVHSANQLCIYGAVTKWCGTNSGDRLESARKTSPENRIKREDLKSLVDMPRLLQASGNRMLQSLKGFNSMPFMRKIEYLRTTAKLFHSIEKGNHYITTTLEDDGRGRNTSMC